MKIYIEGGGHQGIFHGYDTSFRGEGRWLLTIAQILVKLGHDTTFIIDSDEKLNESGIKYRPLNYIIDNEPDCDILFSLRGFNSIEPEYDIHNLPVHWKEKSKNEYIKLVEWHRKLRSEMDKINYNKSVWASFWPTGETRHNHEKITIIYPWEYSEFQSDNNFLPFVFGNVFSDYNFNKKTMHMYTKEIYHDAEYLLAILNGMVNIIKNDDISGTSVSFINFKNKLNNCRGEDEAEIIKSIDTISRHIKILDAYLPYNEITKILSNCKLLIGTNHPILNPSVGEVLLHGGFPIIFENQFKNTIHESINFPFIQLNSTNEEISDFISDAWNNKNLYTKSIDVFRQSLHKHLHDKACGIIGNFINNL